MWPHLLAKKQSDSYFWFPLPCDAHPNSTWPWNHRGWPSNATLCGAPHTFGQSDKEHESLFMFWILHWSRYSSTTRLRKRCGHAIRMDSVWDDVILGSVNRFFFLLMRIPLPHQPYTSPKILKPILRWWFTGDALPKLRNSLSDQHTKPQALNFTVPYSWDTRRELPFLSGKGLNWLNLSPLQTANTRALRHVMLL